MCVCARVPLARVCFCFMCSFILSPYEAVGVISQNKVISHLCVLHVIMRGRKVERKNRVVGRDDEEEAELEG